TCSDEIVRRRLLGQLRFPVLHKRQRLRPAFAGRNRNEFLAIAGRGELARQASLRNPKKGLALSNLERRSAAIHVRCRDSLKVEVIEFFAIGAPSRVRAAASLIRHLPLGSRPGKRRNKYFWASCFARHVRDPPSVRRERSAPFLTFYICVLIRLLVTRKWKDP